MSEKLKIYACSGIGTTDPQHPVTYFTDGTSTVSNTQAVNTILARINALYIEATKLKGLSKEERIDRLCEVDAYSVALEAAKNFQDDTDKLFRAGQVIDLMIHDGLFEYDEMDAQKREAHLDELIAKFQEYMNDGQPITNSDEVFAIWWNQNVIARNQVGLSQEEQETTKKILKKKASQIKGIGKIDPNWRNDPNIGNYLLNSGEYFLYTYLTEDQLKKLPAIFRYKKNRQNRIYNYCVAYFVGIYGSEAEMRSVIRAGIIREFECTPEEACKTIELSGKEPEKVGEIVTDITITTAVLIKIITICAAVVVAIVAAICDCVYKSNTEKYAAMSKQIIGEGNPEAGDYNYGDKLGGGTGSSKKKSDSTAKTILAVLGGALLILNN